MSISDTYDVIVIGGGPAGMMAAGQAASRGLRVLILEKNVTLGNKLSITGGGRCNITNAEFDVRTLLKHYGSAEPFLYSPFAQFGVQDTLDFFTERGVPVVIEDRKRAFPKSQKATDVTHAMEQFARSMGVEIRTGVAVENFKLQDGVVMGLRTTAGVFRANAYVIAVGGKSHAYTGSTGDGFAWVTALGHTVHTPNPNLVPLKVSDAWVIRLQGTTLPGVRVTFTESTQKCVKEGSVLCTHFGLSGPIVLNAAHEVKKMLESGKVNGSINLFPKEDVGALRTRLHELFEVHSNKTLVNALSEWLPTRVAEAVLSIFPEDVRAQRVHSVVREVRYAIVDRLQQMNFTVTGTMGFDRAIVSDGGVDLAEIDTKTMRSKLHPNVYVVGDMLHVNRPSGGYSLQLCWTTGWVAGNSVCRKEGV
jgi:predicted Rossmann fold flavoprotein